MNNLSDLLKRDALCKVKIDHRYMIIYMNIWNKPIVKTFNGKRDLLAHLDASGTDTGHIRIIDTKTSSMYCYDSKGAEAFTQ